MPELVPVASDEIAGTSPEEDEMEGVAAVIVTVITTIMEVAAVAAAAAAAAAAIIMHIMEVAGVVAIPVVRPGVLLPLSAEAARGVPEPPASAIVHAPMPLWKPA